MGFLNHGFRDKKSTKSTIFLFRRPLPNLFLVCVVLVVSWFFSSELGENTKTRGTRVAGTRQKKNAPRRSPGPRSPIDRGTRNGARGLGGRPQPGQPRRGGETMVVVGKQLHLCLLWFSGKSPLNCFFFLLPFQRQPRNRAVARCVQFFVEQGTPVLVGGLIKGRPKATTKFIWGARLNFDRPEWDFPEWQLGSPTLGYVH